METNWIRQRLWKHLNCLVPVYGSGDDAGNYTEVWLDNGEKLLDRRRVKTVLKALATYLGVSWRQQYTAWVEAGRSHLVPIVLGPEMALVPLRLRRPRSRDEGGTGYVVTGNVIKCEPYFKPPYRSRLVLKGGQVLPCFLSIATLELRLLAGRKALQRRWEIYRETRQELVAADPAVYKDEGHLLVEPGGNAHPVRVVNRLGDLIIVCRDNKSSPWS
ncbi:MAG: hypothetical protein PWP41_1966 [Moorella sp. (in: firmicutes)]|uniref:Uncharacterized protein n=1 Tax=Neomoorella thermoacetica TaxID=1525 RepID=A0A1J5P0X5_NEOTH|nr:hypothetical protein [Moorella sp. (in: firmicutes)]OIQ61156.1 hypothetical protein MOTE_02310 [Moorella thermoacetica]